MTTKVVYNACYGSFSISTEALTRMQELGFTGESVTYEKTSHVWLPDCPRHDPILVQVVEEYGKAAGDKFSHLKITTVSGPYRIEDYDGFETVYEPNDYEWITP
jgi:hypothetical protein